LFHGSAVRATISIAKMDFRIDLAGSSTGTMYGAGAYLGESITKADEYGKDEPGGYYDGVFAALLCRTCMGKLYYTTKRDEEAGDKVVGGNFDSTCGDRSKTAGTFRELVVYDNDQLYPEYIVFYQRVYARDDKAKIARDMIRPLQLELPVYWTNCYRELPGSGFFECYEAFDPALGGLQRILNASLTSSHWDIISAKRVENSHTWSAYVNFKLMLRSHIAQKPINLIHDFAENGAVITAQHLQQEHLEQCISLGSIEVDLNEHWLWHATSEESAQLIAKNNFQITQSGAAVSGLRFGPGAYFAESLEKALAYSIDEAGKKCIILCRVALGEVYYTEKDTENTAASTALGQQKNSLLGDPSKLGPREFVALCPEQIYPEFILLVSKP